MPDAKIYIHTSNPDVLDRVTTLLSDLRAVATDRSGHRHSTILRVLDHHGHTVAALQSTISDPAVLHGEFTALADIISTGPIDDATLKTVFGVAWRLLAAANIEDPYGQDDNDHELGDPCGVARSTYLADRLGRDHPTIEAVDAPHRAAAHLHLACDRITQAWTSDFDDAAVLVAAGGRGIRRDTRQLAAKAPHAHHNWPQALQQAHTWIDEVLATHTGLPDN